MKQIPLTQGKFAIVDDEDYEILSQHKWCAMCNKHTYYAARSGRVNGKQYGISMHRVILGATKGQICDHINGDGLDNRRCNLRIATHSQNECNKSPRIGCTSKYKGVLWIKKEKKWRAQIHSNGKRMYLGSFDSEEESAKAYDEAAKEYFGEFARLNFP